VRASERRVGAFSRKVFEGKGLPLLLFSLVASVGVLWALFVPEFEKADEIHHLAYIRYFYRTKSLAVQGASNDPLLEPETQQPPLYYSLASGVYAVGTSCGLLPEPLEPWLTRGETNHKLPNHWIHSSCPPHSLPWDVVALRLIGVILGSTVSITMYFAGRTVASKFAAFVAAVIVSLLPGYASVISSVSNDPLAWAWAGILICLCLEKDRPEEITTVEAGILGTLLGVAVYIKATLYSLAVPMFVALLCRDWRISSRNLAIVALCAGAVSIWWFQRNVRLYHHPLGRQELIRPDLYAWNLDPKSLFSYYFVRPFWQNLFESFVGRFGWMRIRLPVWQYLVSLLVGIALIVGAASAWRESFCRLRCRDPMIRRIGLCVVAITAALVEVVHYNLSVTQPQGRYLFHVLPAVGTCLALGVDWWLSRFIDAQNPGIGAKPAFALSIVATVVCTMVVWNLWALFAVVGPAHALRS
jgi:hypothetical protein